jgi:hypothetical protein
MRVLKRINTFLLIAIVILVLIEVAFEDYLTGIWNKIFIAFLALAIIISVLIEILIKRKNHES